MNIDIGNMVLLTTDDWFYAPDGNLYKAVYGKLKGSFTAEATLGVKPNGKSTNWYVEIGNVTIAGCQIHYCVKTDECSSEGTVRWNSSAEHGMNIHPTKTPSEIYFAED